MFETPDLSHMTSADTDHVYDAAEDTFLLLDALEKDYESIKACSPHIVLEVGSGSGTVSAFVAKMLGSSVFSLCTDINTHAAELTQRTGAQNKVSLQCVVTDLVAGLLPRLAGQVDLLVFNPPYVVTPSEEVGSKTLAASWAGGTDGREVMDRFFPLVPQLLSLHGAFYLVIIKENNQAQIEALMSSYKLKMLELMSRRSGPEHLSILKFTR